MPIIQAFVLEGRTDDQKAGFIAAATAAAVDHLDVTADAVRIIITEMPTGHFGRAGKSIKQIRAEKTVVEGQS